MHVGTLTLDTEGNVCRGGGFDAISAAGVGAAARLQGFPRLTAAADIPPATDPENLERLSVALRDLQARVFTESVPEGLPFSCDAETLSRSNLWNLVTDAGRLDLIFKPSGTQGYDDLARSAVLMNSLV
jgi:hypothetical protein